AFVVGAAGRLERLGERAVPPPALLVAEELDDELADALVKGLDLLRRERAAGPRQAGAVEERRRLGRRAARETGGARGDVEAPWAAGDGDGLEQAPRVRRKRPDALGEERAQRDRVALAAGGVARELLDEERPALGLAGDPGDRRVVVDAAGVEELA